MVEQKQAGSKGEPMIEGKVVRRLIKWLCWYLDCSQRELAARAHVDHSTVCYWNKTETLTRANLALLADAAGLSLAVIDALVLPQLAALRWSGATEEEAFRELADVVRSLEACMNGLGRVAVAELYAFLDESAKPVREPAAAQWERLQQRTDEELLYLVEARPELRSRELVELMAYSSEEAAAEDSGRALAVAQAAHRLAVLLDQEQGGARALQGWSLAHVGNAERVANDFDGADQSFSRALVSWTSAPAEERAALPGWRMLDLEGSLRREQGRYGDSLDRLAEAQASAPPEGIPRVLVKRAFTLVHMNDPEGALMVLAEAAPLVVGHPDPRLAFAVHHNRCTVLVDLERHEEAEQHWPLVEAALQEPRKAHDDIVMIWLRARIDAGLGRLAEARQGFDRARREYAERTMAANYAVVSLERAVLDLKEGRYADVKELAEEMQWIFNAKGLHEEALAALTLFRTAAERQALTVDVAERMVRYLYRAQYDPTLKFGG